MCRSHENLGYSLLLIPLLCSYGNHCTCMGHILCHPSIVGRAGWQVVCSKLYISDAHVFCPCHEDVVGRPAPISFLNCKHYTIFVQFCVFFWSIVTPGECRTVQLIWMTKLIKREYCKHSQAGYYQSQHLPTRFEGIKISSAKLGWLTDDKADASQWWSDPNAASH